MLDNYKPIDNIEEFAEDLISSERSCTIGFLNQYAFNLIQTHSEFRDAMSSLDYVLRDGVGMKMAFKFWGIPEGKNLNGTDFIPLLMSKIASKQQCKYFVFGTEEPYLTKGSEKLLATKDSYRLNGFYDPERYVNVFKEQCDRDKLNVVILAMGMPKQELVCEKLTQVKCRYIIICGGAIVDFHAGRFKRAPIVYRKIGLEWLYRLMNEPSRLFNRYVIGIPVFFSNVLRMKLR